VRTGKLVLPNCDLDDGIPTGAAEYTLADETYANLLAKLSANKFDGTTPQLHANILAFYSDLSLPIETRKDPARWQGVLTDLGRIASRSTLAGSGRGTLIAFGHSNRRGLYCSDSGNGDD
jgi:hypothetical protein